MASVNQTLIERLRIRANIRRNAKGRKSVEEGKPDRIADLLEEAANTLEECAKAAGHHVNRITGSDEYWKGRHDAELAVRDLLARVK